MRSIGGGRWRPQIRVALVTVVAVASCAVGLVALPSTASAYPSSVVSIQGHGYGHGYGMGQWGALGYAINQADYPSILGTYYGGTTLSTLSAGAGEHVGTCGHDRERRQPGHRDLGHTVHGGGVGLRAARWR